MKLICCQCGGERRPGSGKRCIRCYRSNVARKRDGTPDGAVLKELLEMERLGYVECRPVELWIMAGMTIKLGAGLQEGVGRGS